MRIYLLLDPRDQKVRYVGKTKQVVERRLSWHITKAKGTTSKRKVFVWFRELANIKLRPTIRVFCEINGNGIAAEKAVIQFYRHKFPDLLNSSRGGEGGSGRRVTCITPELVARMGKETDTEIGDSVGICREIITYHRNLLNILPCKIRRRGWHPKPGIRPFLYKLTQQQVEMLGKIPDYRLAEIVGCSKHVINRRRRAMEIPPFDPKVKGRITPLKKRGKCYESGVYK